MVIKESIQTEYIKLSDPIKIPGRPICAGPVCPTHRLSNLLDIILKPMVSEIKVTLKMAFIS